MTSWDVIVVGGGPAGLMAGIHSAQSGRKTLLLEKRPSPGNKILLSGGTRCNLTHAADRRGIVEAFGSQGPFLHSALARLGPEQVMDLFEAEGVPTKVEPGGKVFPDSDRAGRRACRPVGPPETHRLHPGPRRAASRTPPRRRRIPACHHATVAFGPQGCAGHRRAVVPGQRIDGRWLPLGGGIGAYDRPAASGACAHHHACKRRARPARNNDCRRSGKRFGPRRQREKGD